MRKSLLLLFIPLLYLISCEKVTEADKPYLIVLSLDGFRWDYTQYANTPVLDSLAKAGLKAKAIIPSYPTKTFPNHYTMATGLYPDHHGIVLNNFFAEDLGRDYNKKDPTTVTQQEFYKGEPLWITAEQQALHSGVLFWVGSEAPTNNLRPSKWEAYNEALSFDARIDTIIQWLRLPASRRPHLIMWYYHEPDETGHKYGPNSPELVEEVERLDGYLSQFFTALRQLELFPKLNVIVTSDHGMAETSADRQIILDALIDTTDLLIWDDGWNPTYNFKVKEDKMEQVYERLKRSPHLNVWKREEIPERLHYGSNPRIHDIHIVADSGWRVFWSWKMGEGKGAHGYDNNFSAMQGIFYAAGPVFKQGYAQPSFANIHLYPLMAKILELHPAPCDGSLDPVAGMLEKSVRLK